MSHYPQFWLCSSSDFHQLPLRFFTPRHILSLSLPLFHLAAWRGILWLLIILKNGADHVINFIHDEAYRYVQICEGRTIFFRTFYAEILGSMGFLNAFWMSEMLFKCEALFTQNVYYDIFCVKPSTDDNVGLNPIWFSINRSNLHRTEQIV